MSEEHRTGAPEGRSGAAEPVCCATSDGRGRILACLAQGRRWRSTWGTYCGRTVPFADGLAWWLGPSCVVIPSTGLAHVRLSHSGVENGTVGCPAAGRAKRRRPKNEAASRRRACAEELRWHMQCAEAACAPTGLRTLAPLGGSLGTGHFLEGNGGEKRPAPSTGDYASASGR